MLVSHRKKFIFLKTVKTGGTSIEGYLEPYCLPEGTHEPSERRAETVTEAGIIGQRGNFGDLKVKPRYWNHMDAAEVAAEVGPAIWGSYLKVSAIRNPHDKLVSWFYFRAGPKGREELSQQSFPENKAAFERFIAENGIMLDRAKYFRNNVYCVDYMIRYEHLGEDLADLSTKLGLDPFDPAALPHYKGGKRPAGRHYSEYYSRDLALKIEEKYAFEFERFGYPRLSAEVS